MMRTLLTALTLAISSTLAIAGGIEFFQGTYDDALVAAQEQGKLIFVDAYAVWCGPCKRMSNQVFPREDVGAFFNENFVSLKLDMERGEGKKFGKKFPVSSYPTLLFIDGNGELVQRVIGAQSPENLIQQAKLAIRKTDNSAQYAKQYAEGNRDPELVLNYIKALNKAGKPVLAVANEFLRSYEKHDDAKIQAVIFESTTQVDSRIFKFFIEQRSALNSQFGQATVDAKIEAAAERTLESALTYNSDALLAEAKAAMEEHLPRRARAFDAKADFEVAKRRKDAGLAFSAAKKVVNADGNTPAANHAVAVELSRYFPDQPKALALAAKMAGVAAKSEANFDHYFTYASLLGATGKGKKALEQAKRAKQLLSEGDDPRRAVMLQELMDQLEG